MASYSQIIADLEAVFGDSSWTGHGVEAYPSNYAPLAGTKPNEYLVIELLTSDVEEVYGADRELRGLIIVQIYVPAGKGTRRVYEISDLLDGVLQKKELGSSIQTGTSFCDIKGNDVDDPALFRADYTLRFSSY